jgi:hypothetical protein
MARQEQEREEQRQRVIDSIVIRDVKPNCFAGPVHICYLEAVVTNGLQDDVREISFGWILRPQMATCPAKLATKKTIPVILPRAIRNE